MTRAPRAGINVMWWLRTFSARGLSARSLARSRIVRSVTRISKLANVAPRQRRRPARAIRSRTGGLRGVEATGRRIGRELA
jgi:hypothetical protein